MLEKLVAASKTNPELKKDLLGIEAQLKALVDKYPLDLSEEEAALVSGGSIILYDEELTPNGIITAAVRMDPDAGAGDTSI